MSEICQSLKLRHVMEVRFAVFCVTEVLTHCIMCQPFKMYPRDFMATGRLRVEIIRSDGSYSCDDIKNSKMSLYEMWIYSNLMVCSLQICYTTECDLLKKMGTLIPLLKSRIKRMQENAAAQQQQIQQSTNSVNVKKKKGKKGRKWFASMHDTICCKCNWLK